MRGPKNSRTDALATGRRYESVTVHHPDALMGEQKVERVIDSIGFMVKRFPLEYAVATRIRRAYDSVHGQAGGASDFERPRGGVGWGRSPQDGLLDSCTLLKNLPKSGAGDLGLALVDLVVCEGKSILSVAHMGLNPSRNRNFYGERLRQALRVIAGFWGWDEDRPQAKILGFAAKQTADVPEKLIRGVVMHATGRKVFPL